MRLVLLMCVSLASLQTACHVLSLVDRDAAASLELRLLQTAVPEGQGAVVDAAHEYGLASADSGHQLEVAYEVDGTTVWLEGTLRWVHDENFVDDDGVNTLEQTVPIEGLAAGSYTVRARQGSCAEPGEEWGDESCALTVSP